MASGGIVTQRKTLNILICFQNGSKIIIWKMRKLNRQQTTKMQLS